MGPSTVFSRAVMNAGRKSRRRPSASTRSATKLVSLSRAGKRKRSCRLEIRAPPVDHRFEHRDRVLLRRELVEALHHQRPFGRVGREAVRVAIVGQHFVAMFDRLVRPDVEALHERQVLETLFERRPDQPEIERLGLRLRHPQQHIDVRRLEHILQALRGAAGGFLRQLAQDHGRRSAQRGNRSELEIEEDGHRNRDRHRERGRQAKAAIVQQLVDHRRTDAAPCAGRVHWRSLLQERQDGQERQECSPPAFPAYPALSISPSARESSRNPTRSGARSASTRYGSRK